jgi:hypothetical protein
LACSNAESDLRPGCVRARTPTTANTDDPTIKQSIAAIGCDSSSNIGKFLLRENHHLLEPLLLGTNATESYSTPLWVRWSDAVLEAVFEPNQKQTAIDNAVLLEKLIALVRVLQSYKLQTK